MNADTLHRRRWLILGVLALCVFIGTMDNTILNVALPKVQDELGASNSQLQWAIDAYTLTFAALLFTAGVLGDRYGRRLVLAVGLTVFGLASLYTAMAGDPTELIIGRVLMGIGVAVVPGGTLSILIGTFPAEERVKAIGLWSVAGGLALALGPLIGGALLHSFWWGSIFLVNVPLVVVVVVLIFWLIPEAKSPVQRRLDLSALVLSAAGVGLLTFGIIRGGENGDWSGFGVLAPMIGGVALLVVLGVVEQRIPHPALDFTLFRKPAFGGATLALAISMLSFTGGTYVLAFYLQVVRGYSPFVAGTLMIPVAVGTMVMAKQTPTLVPRFGPGPLVATGLLFTTIGLAYYATLSADSTLWLFIPVQLLVGAGVGMVMAPAPAVAMSVVPPERAGAGAAVPNMMRQLGAAIGIAILGSVLGTVYRSDTSSLFDGLSPADRHAASGSIGATARFAATSRGAGQLVDHTTASGLARPVIDAFLSAQAAAMWTAVGFGVVGVIAAWLLLPSPRKEARAARRQDLAEVADDQKADAAAAAPVRTIVQQARGTS